MSDISQAAKAMGSKGGKARAKNMTAKQRSAAARKAVKERWRLWRERNKR